MTPPSSCPGGYRLVKIVFTVLVWLWVSPALCADAELVNLFTALAERGSDSVSYTETKTSSFLDLPQVQTGVMEYRKPDTLIRKQATPVSVYLRVEGDEITVKDFRGKRHLDLRSVPLVKAFLSPLRTTLTGDLQTLEKHYLVEFHIQGGHWTLRLTPRNEQLRKIVSEVLVTGSGSQVRRIDIRESDGDRTVTDLRPVEVQG